MECACISAEIDDCCDLISDKIVTAIKTHQCDECGADITPGAKYRREKTFYDGNFSNHKTCLDCNSVREQLVCGFYYGEIWQLVWENIVEFDDEQPWTKFSRLTPVARNRVLEFIENQWNDYYFDNPTQPALRLEAKFQKYPYWGSRPKWMDNRKADMRKLDLAL